jgi:hypothetical protein
VTAAHRSLRKSNKTEAVDPESGYMASLFHPLRDSWEEHFVLTVDGVTEGQTAIGRATIEALSINDSWPKAARALQLAAGWLKPQN